jgi:hypothetical protein
MFRDIEALKRESFGRHKAERLLDNNLYGFHKNAINKKVKKIKKMDKTMKERMIKQEQAKKEEDISELKTKPKSIASMTNSFTIGEENRKLDIKMALNKILPHFLTKFGKSIKMMSSLFKAGLKDMEIGIAMAVLIKLFENIDMLETENDFKFFESKIDILTLFSLFCYFRENKV